MAQFGGNKNPPWAQGGRPGPPGGGSIDVPGLVAAGAFGAATAGQPPVFHQGGPPGLGLGHLGHGPAVTLAAMAGQPGVFPRTLGPGGFPGGALIQQQQQPQVMLQPPQQPPQQPQGQAPASQRVFTGTVTKLHDNFGFVDEDVFFQTTVVKGQAPRVNDRVLVEAAYNANMPFKWNATRIQVLPNQSNARSNAQQQIPSSSTTVTTTSSLNAHAFSNAAAANMSHPPPRIPPASPAMQQRNEAAFGGGGRTNDPSPAIRMRNNSPPRDSMKMRNSGGGEHRRRDERSSTRDRDRDHRERSRDKERRSSPTPSTASNSRKRSRSPQRRSRSRSRSPPRRRARTAPRYNVSVPKVPLNFPESSVCELKKRYSNMYVPSDFFLADHSWMKSFPIHDSFKIQYASSFHIFNKDLVESPLLSDAIYDPTDADHSFSAKVMLMAVPPPQGLFEKTCLLAESSATARDSLVHPTRAIQFLVGTRGKNETMSIGGAWSPSLDGPNPDSDPSVLIRTAIRVCRALTGIDLSNCTQWHRFLEIHYRRQESSSKPARTETTVIFLPDIWTIMPTPLEHEEAKTLYEKALEARINPPPVVQQPIEKEESDEKSEAPADEVQKPEVEDKVMAEDSTKADEVADNDQESMEADDLKKDPTPWQNLDVKTLKVTELRDELNARGLNSKGLKSQLAGRLQKALKDEQDLEEKSEQPSEEEKQDEPAATPPEEEKIDDISEVMMETESPSASEAAKAKDVKPPVAKGLDEKQKQALKNAYKFPSEPCILVHPHPKAKSGKFDCTVMNLSVLLDYRTEDNKEGTFEVSLFAELFNEMLMRDSGFKVYKAIVEATEKPQESSEKPSKTASASESKESEEEEKEKEDAKAKKKTITKNKDLLLACSYFDLGHCGYFETKDLEDILATMSFNLSRAQIKKLVTKVTTGKDQQVNYRQFTDCLEDEEPSCSNVDEEALGQGFRAFLPHNMKPANNDAPLVTQSDGICNYRGSVVDVAKLLTQLKRSEQARSETEAQLKSSLKTVQELKEASEKHSSVKDKLQAEVKDLRKQLKRVEDDMKRSQTDSSKYYTILKDIYAKVHPAVNAPTSPTPSKEALIKKEEPAEEIINGKCEDEK